MIIAGAKANGIDVRPVEIDSFQSWRLIGDISGIRFILICRRRRSHWHLSHSKSTIVGAVSYAPFDIWREI